MSHLLTENIYTYCSFRLPFFRFGEGKQLIFAFHGFGRTGEDFQKLHAALGDNYTVIAPNFFFHNNNSFPKQWVHLAGLSKKELAELLFHFVNHFTATKPPIVLGYSLGGKLALILHEAMIKNPFQTFIVAPDGLVIQYWYKWVSRFPVLRSIYLHFIEYPALFFHTINLGKKLGWMPVKQHTFLTHQMQEKENREKIYNVWMLLRSIDPTYKQLKKYGLNKLQLIMGKHDQIIPMKYAYSFQRKTNLHPSHLHIINNGHDFIKQWAMDEIAAIIKQEKQK